jgi:kynurenine formamidase
MVKLEVKIVGMDMLGPDYDKPWATHKVLLGNDILILENLTNLDQLLNIEHFDVIALPAKLHSDAAPVRVVAIIK